MNQNIFCWKMFACLNAYSFHKSSSPISNSGFRALPVVSTSASLAQCPTFDLTEWTTVSTCTYTQSCTHVHTAIIHCHFCQSALMYITRWSAVVMGGEERRRGGGEEGGRLVLVRCLVSVETDGVEKTNYLFLAKDSNRMLEQRRCCKCVTRTKNILFRLAAQHSCFVHYADVSLGNDSLIFSYIYEFLYWDLHIVYHI